MAPSDTGHGTGWEALEVDEASEGMRLDSFLASRLSGISRMRVRAMIESEEVRWNGRQAAPSRKIRTGDRIEWLLPPVEEQTPQPEPIPLSILYEDEHLIVIDKPAGLVVHPGAGNRSGTLVNALLHHCGGGLSRIGSDRPGIVHRIDKDTSGILVAAKSDLAHAGLAAAFADHGRTGELERAYRALVWGHPVPASGTIRAPLGRAADRVRRAVVSTDQADAREAVTRYKTLESFPAGAALLECRLETGRTHQIRVHMAHIGQPVIGDPLYSRGFATKALALKEPLRRKVEGFDRQALHAAVLGFTHPVSGTFLRFESPLPADFSALLEAFRLDKQGNN